MWYQGLEKYPYSNTQLHRLEEYKMYQQELQNFPDLHVLKLSFLMHSNHNLVSIPSISWMCGTNMNNMNTFSNRYAWNLRLSQLWVWRLWSSGMWCHVVWKTGTNIWRNLLPPSSVDPEDWDCRFIKKMYLLTRLHSIIFQKTIIFVTYIYIFSCEISPHII